MELHGFVYQQANGGATRHLIARPLVKPLNLLPRQSQAKRRAKGHLDRGTLANGNPMGYDAQAPEKFWTLWPLSL